MDRTEDEATLAWVFGDGSDAAAAAVPAAHLPGAQSPRAVDMRSDTVTKPTREMRRAMALAVVDDDVLGNDPTAKQLEDAAAALFGKEAGLFVPSGTMSNLIAVMTHCDRRDSEAIVGADSHMHIYEQGGMATVGGVHPRVMPNQADGTIALEDLARAIRGQNDHFPTTRLVCLENTHNAKGGRVLSVEYTDKVGELCKAKDIRLHIDGARIFNALAVLGVAPSRLVQAADSVSICLSKGLGAPLGSVLVGSKEFIYRARRCRKVLGGGMRQCGVVAAAGLVALTQMPPKLQQDHANCKALAAGLAAIDGVSVALEAVESNILFANVTGLVARLQMKDAAELAGKLKGMGVWLIATGPMQIRIVTHHQVTEDDVKFVLAAFQSL